MTVDHCVRRIAFGIDRSQVSPCILVGLEKKVNANAVSFHIINDVITLTILRRHSACIVYIVGS
jgi:hypothetical protein